MEIYRQFSDDRMQSHIEELEPQAFEKLKSWTHAKAFRFHVHAPGTFLDWHPANGKFLIVVLSGALEIGVTDGTRMLCRPGVLRITSDAGKGHTGRVVGDEPCVVLMVDIDE
jgi:hypothetical protein